MEWNNLLKKTIRSIAKKENIKIKTGILELDGLVIFESGVDNKIYTDRTLSFLDGFRCANEIQKRRNNE